MDTQSVVKEGEKQEAPSAAPTTSKQGQRRRRPRQRASVVSSEPDPFAPRHLTAPGPVMNDPLTDKCFFPHAGETLAPTPGIKHIYPGCDGLQSLATAEYIGLVAHTFSVKRSISLSGYAYYAAALTWARLLDVDAKNGGKLSFDERQFIDQCVKYRPPKILGSYLSSLGDTSHPSGFHELRMRIIKPKYVTTCTPPGFPGYFGKMKDNAGFYASYPCLAVYAQRVMNDLRATSRNEVDLEWDLPGDMSYPDHPLRHACLGYAPGQPLDRSIQNTYMLIGITENRFAVDNDSIAINIQLMNEVQSWIEEVRGLVQVPFPQQEAGSRGQLLEEHVVVPRADVSSTTWIACSPHRLSSGVEFAGSTFLYRVVKLYRGPDAAVKMDFLLPYARNGEEEFPNLNFLRDAEDDPLLSSYNGLSAEFVVHQRLRGFMSANIKL